MIMTLFRRLYARFIPRRSRTISPGHIDPHLYDEVIEAQRKLGSKIGLGVRLIGKIDSINPHLITIGDYSVIGGNSILLSHCPIKGARPCRVGNYVYLGYGVIVLPGVSIGDFSIIGAGAVVTRDIPSGTIAAGNPARVIRSLTDVEKKHLEATMNNYRLFGYDPCLTSADFNGFKSSRNK